MPDLRLSHAPSTLADQAHSRAAVTAIAALPPSAGSGPSTGCIVIAQRLTLVGEVTEETLVDEEPHACRRDERQARQCHDAADTAEESQVVHVRYGSAARPIRNGAHCQKAAPALLLDGRAAGLDWNTRAKRGLRSAARHECRRLCPDVYPI